MFCIRFKLVVYSSCFISISYVLCVCWSSLLLILFNIHVVLWKCLRLPPLLPDLHGFESSTWALAALSAACKRDAGGVKWRAAEESEERAVRGTSEKDVQAEWRVKANLKITMITSDPVFD